MAPAPAQPAPPTPPGRLALRRGLTLLGALLLGLPLFQQMTDFLPDAPLAGSEVRTYIPDFSWEDWFEGTYATRVEDWLQGRAGFRGLLVHLACQANYSLFGRIGMENGTEISQGRDHWLYETAYIKHASRQPPFLRRKATAFADRAAALTRRLAERNIAFAIVISPSKAEVLPEHLPPAVQLPPRSAETAYALVTAELAARHVPFVDSRRLFLNMKQTEPRLFPKTGTHWSVYGAWLAWQRVAAELEARQPERPFPSPAPDRLVMSPPLGADDDLRRLLNLWHFEPSGPERLPYPLVPPPPPGCRDRYQALVVGDSFSLTLVDAMARSGLFRQIDLLYYFKRRFTYPAPSFTPAPDRLIAQPGIDMGMLDLANLDWKGLLDNRQLILLVINEYHLKDTGWGVMESLLAELDRPNP